LIRVYSIPQCPPCAELRKWLDSEKIPYEYLDVEKNPEAKRLFEELASRTGIAPLFPVVESGGEVILQGFSNQPDEKDRIRKASERLPPIEDLFASRKQAIRDEKIHPSVRSALAAEEYFGRTPLPDFNRLWNRFIYSFGAKRWTEAEAALREAEGLAGVLVSDYGGDFTELADWFALAKRVIRSEGPDFGKISLLREVCSEIQQRLLKLGIGLAPVL